MKSKKKLNGFYYYVDNEKIEMYKKTPLWFRFKWLYQLNELRKCYPKDIIVKQEKFRKGEI